MKYNQRLFYKFYYNYQMKGLKMTTLFLEKQITNNLQSRLEKIYVMKWLLGLRNDEDTTFEELQNKINICIYSNISYLTVVHQFVIQLPKTMTKIFSKLLTLENNINAYMKLNEKFKNYVKHNDDFIEFERYVNLQINYESEIKEVEIKVLDSDINIVEEKKLYNMFLFNLFEGFINDYSMFQKENYVYNFPKLYAWINEYKNKPIGDLSEDECKIITGIIHSMSYDEMIDNLELNVLNQNYISINRIMSNLPQKFSVYNLTQMIFRIILLKPYLFDLFDDKLIVRGLKNLKQTLSNYKA